MKRLLTLLALVLCSCAETFVGEEIARPNNENLPDLTASFTDEEATRTYIEEGKYLRWNEDDRLTIFYGNTLNRQYKFNGATGDNSGTFSLVPSGELGTGNTLDAIYAIYPYDENASITDSGVISLTLPATQSYTENSFGRGANTMLAVTENLEDTFLSFKNACGYLKLKLYNAGGASIKSIEVKGKNGERLAGAATATIAFGEAPVLAMADDATSSVVLDCGEGVVLGTTAEMATEFWVVLPATTFAEGLTITATDTEGKVFKKSTTKEVVIERNAIQPLAVLEAKFVATKPANNEIWYTATAKVTPYSSNVFGANIVSNTYDAAKKCWVIKFDGDVTRIGSNAFYDCSSLTSITIPNSVTMIGDYALALCIKLTSINIPDSVTTIGQAAFNRCDTLTSIIIPNSVTTIERDAFCGCYGLSSIIIPDNVTTIRGNTFLECRSLTSVTIPNSVTTIEWCAFEGCISLTNISLPDSVTTIGERAFQNCSNLSSITLSNSLTTIGKNAFYNCSSLASITIPNSVTTIEYNAFYGCKSLTSVTIPDGVTTIGESAFGSCSSLESVTIPDGVTTIGDDAFRSCTSLTSVTIPDSVTTIGEWAFENCSSLTSVTVGNGVTSIGERAFYSCDDIESVYCKATTPPSLGGSAFSTWAYNLKIYVPMKSVEAYKGASGWSMYKSYIVGYDLYEVVDMGLSVKWAATNVGADSPEELGNLYAWGEVSPKTEYYSSNYAWWTYDYSEDGDGWWSTTSIKKYGSSYSNSDYIRWDGYYDSYYWVNDGLTVLDFEDDAARTGWGGSWRMPTQAECQELVDNCTIEKVKYNNCDGFLFTSTKVGYTDKKLFFPLTPSKQLDDETTYAEFYSGLFWSSTQYLPFPACAYVFRSRYPYTSCTLGPITRNAGFPVRPVKQ